MTMTELWFALHPLAGWGIVYCGLALLGYLGLRLGSVTRWSFVIGHGVVVSLYGYSLWCWWHEELSIFRVRAWWQGAGIQAPHDISRIPEVIADGFLDPLYMDVWLSILMVLVVLYLSLTHARRYLPLAALKHNTSVVNAQWMNLREAKRTFKSGDVIIGEAVVHSSTRQAKGISKASLLTFAGDKHLLTCSGTGGGKTTSVTIPNLLTYPHGLVVLDPKGDVTPQIQIARERAHQRKVHVINPLTHTGGINVLGRCDISTPKVLTHIRSIAKWICGEKEGGSQDHYFTESAHSLIECLIAYEVFSHPKDPSLRRVRDHLSLPLDQLQTLLKTIYEQPTPFGFGIPQKLAGPLYGLPAKQFAGSAGIADTAAKFLVDENVLQCVTKDTVDLGELTHGKVDIVIQLSLELMGTYPGLSRLLLGSILYYVYHVRPKEQILFLIDEMPRLGYMRLLEEARDVGRGLGIKLWCILQELGQLRKLYGQDGVSAWLENTSVQQFFGIKGLETAKRLVDTLGETMVDVSSVSLHQQETATESRSVATQKHKRALITVDEILQMGPDNQLILSEHNKPLLCGKAVYYKRKEFLRMLKEGLDEIFISLVLWCSMQYLINASMS